MISQVLRVGIGLYLIFPFLMLVSHLGNWTAPDFEQVGTALRFSTAQALISAVLSVALGFVGALGLNFWARYNKIFRLVVLLPNLVPPLFVMIAAFQIFRPFPFGLTGIVLINTMINVGLCAVVIQALMEEKIGGWAELALVEGSSKLRFLGVVLRHLKSDLALVGYFVFCVCFSSLTIPLLAGRFNTAGLEILIYEKLTIGENISDAFTLAFIQSIFIFLLGMALPTSQTLQNSGFRKLTLLQWRWGSVVPIVISMLIFFEALLTAPIGLAQIGSIGWGLFGAEEAIISSLVVGFAVGATVYLLCCAICFSLPHRHFQKFITAYIAPSTALTAFAYLILDWRWPLALTTAALVSLFLPIAFRLTVAGAFQGILQEIEVAHVLGARRSQIFWNVTLPRLSKSFGAAAGLAAFWAVGDFAVSGVLMESTPLAVLSKKLMETYRIEAASFFVLVLLLLGCAQLFIFWSLGYVLSDRPLSRLRRL